MPPNPSLRVVIFSSAQPKVTPRSNPLRIIPTPSNSNTYSNSPGSELLESLLGVLAARATGNGGAEASGGRSVNHQGRRTSDGAEGAAEGSGAEYGLHGGQLCVRLIARQRVSIEFGGEDVFF